MRSRSKGAPPKPDRFPIGCPEAFYLFEENAQDEAYYDSVVNN